MFAEASGAFLRALGGIGCGALTPSPTSEFLYLCVAFEVTIIAIAIPLSLDIVSRMSELYRSEVISRKFSQEPSVKVLPGLLMLNIAIIILMRFFERSLPETAWAVLSWVVMGFFLLIAGVLLRFFFLLKRYTVDTAYILDKLFADAEKAAGSLEKAGPAAFALATEGIAEVLAFEVTRSNRNDMVIAYLGRLHGMISGLPAGRADPLQASLPELRRALRGRRRDTVPPVACDAFSTAIRELLKIHQAATASENVEIGRCTTDLVASLLDEGVVEPGRDMFVEQLLSTLAEVGRKAMDRRDQFAFIELCQWYVDIVFDVGRESGTFDLSYLEAFDRHFFASFKLPADRNEQRLFEALLSSVIYRVSVPRYSSADAWRYVDSYVRGAGGDREGRLGAEEVSAGVARLDEMEASLWSLEDYGRWEDGLRELWVMLEHGRGLEPGPDSPMLRSKLVRDARTRFKYNNLLYVLFAACAYSLEASGPDFTLGVWEMAEPLNADARAVLSDLVPPVPAEVMSRYMRRTVLDRRFAFGGGATEGRRRLRQYFLLLLLRSAAVSRRESGSPAGWRDAVSPPRDVYLVGELLEMCPALASETRLLASLGFDPGPAAELLGGEVPRMLRSVVEPAGAGERPRPVYGA